MKATLLSIGDEILIGQTLNTNAHWMARELTLLGISVERMATLQDDAADIRSGLDQALKTSDIVLITGGLGPTSDDITRDVLAGYFGSDLHFDQRAYDMIDQLFIRRGRTMTEATKDLARVPSKALTIYNSMGTAPGALYHINGKLTVSMPGVPYEMEAMMMRDVIPYLKDHFDLPVIVYSHIRTAGRGESQLAEKLQEVETGLGPDVRIAYLPSVGEVKIRLTARGNDRASLEKQVEAAKGKVMEAIGEHVYGFDDDSLEASVGRQLKELKLTIGTAESCTGGNIAGRITSVPGSSAYFLGSVVSYSNKVKHDLLGVNAGDLAEHGAVSEPVVRQMILGANRQLGTDVAIAVSGIAGPSGGSEEKPVGTVFIGVGHRNKQWVKRFLFTGDRGRNIELTTVVALVMLRKFLHDEFVKEVKKG